MKFLVALTSVFLLAAGFAPHAHAITVVPRNFDELVARADTVFKGSVATVTSQWIGEGSIRHIVTFVTFQVEETYKGEAAPVQTLRFLGGTVGPDTLEVADMPIFTTGQKAVLFVVGNGKQFCPLVGVYQGRFHVTTDSAGLERVTTNDGSPVASTAEIGQFEADGTPTLRRYAAKTPGMTAASFKAEILGKVTAQKTSPANQPKGVQP